MRTLTGETIVPVTPVDMFPYLDDGKPEEREQAFHMCMALLTKCDELWVAGEHITESMRREIRAAARLEKSVYSMQLEQERIQAALADMRPMLEQSVCFKYSNEKNFINQLLVLNPSALSPWAQEPENQLWVGRSGFGCRPSARGRAVYATSIYTGKMERWDRSDFHGVAIYIRLPDWARERFEEFRQSEQGLQNQDDFQNDNDESEELEL